MIYIFVLIDFVPTNNQNLLMTHCENWGCFCHVIETLICHTRTLWHFCCCLHKSRPTFGKHGSLTHDKNIHKRRPFSQCVVSWFQMLAGTKSIKKNCWSFITNKLGNYICISFFFMLSPSGALVVGMTKSASID